MQLEENANYALQPLGGGEYFGVTEKTTLQRDWWARSELNWRSLPCQGNVMTPRPRARWPNDSEALFIRIGETVRLIR